MIYNNKGTIITFVVVIIGIVGLLYATTFMLINMENKINNSLEDRTKAYYVAEGGLERAKAMLLQGYTDSFILTNPFSEQYKEQHSIEVSIVEVGPNVYKITSTGVVERTKRIMEAQILRIDDEAIVQSWKEVN